MKFANVSIKQSSKVEFLAIVNTTDNSIVKVKDVYEVLGIDCPKDMIALIEGFNDSLLHSITEVLKTSLPSIPLDEVQILSPISYPRRNVFCLGKNYVDHANEIKSIPGGGNSLPENPIYFTKLAYPTMGPEDTLFHHKDLTNELDYEVELAIIIKKKGKNISKNEAQDYIFGYTIGNDISIRNIQLKHIQWFKGKSLDTCCPIGPYIVTQDELSFPPNLDISCKINGELRQNSNTSKLIFDIPTILQDLSQGLTLYPGDIIFTGTPSGVGFGFKPPKTLNPGDVIECEIENLGVLRNYVEK